jgi:hypothetical protein
MARFSTGTTDHDGDGRMGGSRKGGDMAKTPAKPRRSAARREQESAETAEAAIQPKVKKSALEEQFAAADEKGAASLENIQNATLSRVIRGY